jgi:hypothetical protein
MPIWGFIKSNGFVALSERTETENKTVLDIKKAKFIHLNFAFFI